MAKRRERSSTFSKKESPSLQGEGKAEGIRHEQKYQHRPSNVARADLGSTQVEAEAPRRRRRTKRAPGAIPSSPPNYGPKSPNDEMHGCQYGHESRTNASEDDKIIYGRSDDETHGCQYGHENRTKASEDEVIFYGRISAKPDYTKPEIVKYDKTSKEAITKIKTKPSRETKRKHRRKDPTIEGLALAAGSLTAAALKDHERKYSSSNRNTRPGLSRQKISRKTSQGQQSGLSG